MMLYEDLTRKIKLTPVQALYNSRTLSDRVNVFRNEFPESVLAKDKSGGNRRR